MSSKSKRILEILVMYELEHLTTPAGLILLGGSFGRNNTATTVQNNVKKKKKECDVTPDDLFDFSKLGVEGHVKALNWARKQRITRSKIFNIIKLSVKNNLHKAVSVSSSYCDTVKYAQVLQLHIIDCYHEEYGDTDNLPDGRVLCANIPSIRESKFICEGCNLRAGIYLDPCVRNTFQFLDPSGITLIGRPVMFNRDIVITLYDTEECRPLYIEGYCKEDYDLEEIPNHLNLRFTCAISTSCYFRIRHPILQRRAQYDGTVVPPDVRIVFQHANTGLCLATEYDVLEENIFGMEPVVDLRTYLSQDGIHCKENLFVIFVG